MEKYKGKPVFCGIAMGNISFYSKNFLEVRQFTVKDVDAELERYRQAKEEAVRQLKNLYDKAEKEVGMQNARIFEVHSMMLEDENYHLFVVNMIRKQQVNAEYAVYMAGEHFSKIFGAMEDEYFRERAADVKDASECLQGILSGRADKAGVLEPSIIIAKELSPSETVQMDKSKVQAFVIQSGSSYSHVAILAKTMNIPAVSGIEVKKEWDGKYGIVDGYSGILYIDPDQDTIRKFQEKQQEELEKRETYKALRGKENISLSGEKIDIFANIGNVRELDLVSENDAGGIGLFRSEFLYLEKKNYPTEEEQFNVYKEVARYMDKKQVIIRTLDIGADKQTDYFQIEKEENPAMGYRAIRICLDRVSLFKVQLRAILRASAYGNIAIMYPMIISVDEVRKIKQIVEEVKKELTLENIPYSHVKQGIMIETPAAAIISDLLAKEVDFFSIGTNDLTQYTLAIDRQNVKLDYLYDSHHEAVLRMIETVVENAHKEGIWVGICGELAADTSLTERFLKMGVDELSVSPSFVLPVRKAVRESKIK